MILLIISLFINFAYNSESNHLEIMNGFQSSYNNSNYEEIFNKYNDDFKKYLDKVKSDQFLSTLKTNLGLIKSYEYEGLNKNFHEFKIVFENSTMSLLIAIDDKNKISGLSIKPYEVKNSIKYIDQSNIPDDIKSILLKKLNNFPNHSQLSIAIIKDGKTKFYGLKIENNSIIDIDNKDKIFEIGSITKVFSSVLLAKFITDRKVKLDDNINKYLDYKFNNDTKISFISLANHTSGLPRLPTNLVITNENISNPYLNYIEDDLVEYLTKTLEIENKDNYNYSNLGAALIPYVLSKIDKKEIKQLYNEYIFKKYKMSSSYCDNNDNLDLVYGINTDGNIVSNWDFDVLFGAGGILSNTSDLSKFLLSFNNHKNKELNLTLEKTFKNTNVDIGLGWHNVKYNKTSFMWHNGGTGGYSSSMAYDKKTNNGIIILTNITSFHPQNNQIDLICFELMSIIK